MTCELTQPPVIPGYIRRAGTLGPRSTGTPSYTSPVSGMLLTPLLPQGGKQEAAPGQKSRLRPDIRMPHKNIHQARDQNFPIAGRRIGMFRKDSGRHDPRHLREAAIRHIPLERLNQIPAVRIVHVRAIGTSNDSPPADIGRIANPGHERRRTHATGRVCRGQWHIHPSRPSWPRLCRFLHAGSRDPYPGARNHTLPALPYNQ